LSDTPSPTYAQASRKLQAALQAGVSQEAALAAVSAAGEALLPWVAREALTPVSVDFPIHRDEETHAVFREALRVLEPMRLAIHAQADLIREHLPVHEDPRAQAFLIEMLGMWIVETTATAWKIHECDAPEISHLTLYGAAE